MPSRPPLISLDNEGVCNYCRNHQAITFKGEEPLIRILKESRNKRNKYDCMVNISGGRDSSYTLLSLVRDYRMRVLAVNYANPFTDEQAKKNIENMVRILGVDFIQFNLKHYIHEKILRNNILTWFKNPSAAMVPTICIGCKIIWPEMLKIARKNQIKCIVNGGNPYEYTSFKRELLGISMNANLKWTYFANIRGLFRESLKNLSYLNPRYLPVTLKGYLFGNQYAIGSRLFARSIRGIDFFHYIPWNENKIISRIRDELDWDYPRNLNSTWRFDCNIAHLKDFMYLKTLGITEKDDFYSKMIRERQITREQGLTRIKNENRLHLDLIYDVFSKLAIGHVDLEKEIVHRC
jgi:tRNA(Ile)-lysidine synthase TilS/MesJ